MTPLDQFVDREGIVVEYPYSRSGTRLITGEQLDR